MLQRHRFLHTFQGSVVFCILIIFLYVLIIMIINNNTVLPTCNPYINPNLNFTTACCLKHKISPNIERKLKMHLTCFFHPWCFLPLKMHRNPKTQIDPNSLQLIGHARSCDNEHPIKCTGKIPLISKTTMNLWNLTPWKWFSCQSPNYWKISNLEISSMIYNWKIFVLLALNL